MDHGEAHRVRAERSAPLSRGDSDSSDEDDHADHGDHEGHGQGQLLYFDVPLKRSIRRLQQSFAPDAATTAFLRRGTGRATRFGVAACDGSAGEPVPHERLIRSDLWSRHGQPMHFLTLEFKDLQIEANFQADSMRRSKRWVMYMVAIMGILNFVLLLFRAAIESEYCEGLPLYLFLECGSAVLLYSLQYLQVKLDNDFFREFMHETLFLWSMWRTTASLGIYHMLKYHSDRDCKASHKRVAENADLEMSQTVLLVELFLAFRVRFVYFLIFVLYLLLGHGTLVLGLRTALWEEPPTRLLLMCACCCFLSYTFEVLQRQDFVMSTMAWRESQRSQGLLHNILPAAIAAQLKQRTNQGTLRCEDPTIAEHFDCVSVLFADVVSFTTMSAQISPVTLVHLLNKMFQRFDELAQDNDVEKIKTIGDCYMAAAGLPMVNENHAKTMARFGLQMLQVVGEGSLRNPVTNEPIQVRVGMHSGPCVAGIIGHKKFAYDIWGDAVNTASRMESSGEPMKLHCSQESYEFVRDDFVCQPRGKITVKGKGEMQTYFVVEEQTGAKGKSFISDVSMSSRGSLLLRSGWDGEDDDFDDVDAVLRATSGSDIGAPSQGVSDAGAGSMDMQHWWSSRNLHRGLSHRSSTSTQQEGRVRRLVQMFSP